MIVKNTLEITPIILIYVVLYLIANQIQFVKPVEVVKTPVDHFFQFNEHWVWIYLSSYISVPLMYVLYLYKMKSFFIKSFMTLTVASFIIYMIVPTYVSRSNLDLTQLNSLYHLVFTLIHTADNPTNCLPSLHVSTAVLLSCLFWKMKYMKSFYLSVIYFILISLSTMYVGQHLFLDVVSGFLIAIFVFGIIYIQENKDGQESMG